jgi:uncharacterized protein (TIGR02271 family)
MSENQNDKVIGQFADSSSAELAAQAALKNGFAVQLVDPTTVHVRSGSRPQDAGEIEGLLAAYGATNIPKAHSATADGRRTDRGGKIELAEERLEARPHTVVAGEVRVSKKVVSETLKIEVPVEREELLVERVPLQRNGLDQAPDSSGTDPLVQAFSERLRDLQPGEAVRIPIVEEEVIVHKQPVVRNELVIGKRLAHEVQQFTQTVRREVPDIDRKGDVRVAEVEEHS